MTSATETDGKTRRSVLLIDDDQELASLMSSFLTENGYRVEIARDGRAGLSQALAHRCDLVILDFTLPYLGGMEVLRQLRRRSQMPVIVLTARATHEDRIEGLQAGADDYLTKPFAPGELLARIGAVLRRSGLGGADRTDATEVSGIRLDAGSRTVERDGAKTPLTSAEFDILDLLMRSAGRVVSRDEIASILYQRETTPYERALDVHISHLRKKLERGDETLIRTVRGVGYLFKPEL